MRYRSLSLGALLRLGGVNLTPISRRRENPNYPLTLKRRLSDCDTGFGATRALPNQMRFNPSDTVRSREVHHRYRRCCLQPIFPNPPPNDEVERRRIIYAVRGEFLQRSADPQSLTFEDHARVHHKNALSRIAASYLYPLFASHPHR